jgi:fructuronate reductase
VDDKGQTFEPSPDPLLEEAQGYVKDIKLGETDSAKVKEAVLPLLKNAAIFGTDLEAAGLSDKIVSYYMELLAGEGAVRGTLQKYCK